MAPEEIAHEILVKAWEDWHRPGSVYLVKRALVAECADMIAQAIREAVAEKDARIAELDAENLDLHLVAQGIKHYWRCSRHFAGHGQPHLCDRCGREDAEADARDLLAVAEAARALNAQYTGASNAGPVGAVKLWIALGKTLDALDAVAEIRGRGTDER